MIKRFAEHVTGEAERVEMVQPGEVRLRGDVTVIFNCLMERHTEKMAS